ncbi:MAG: hypothetical protein NVSMB34_07920 [Variovorax sp.]
MPSAHIDTFAARHLPPPGQQPEYLFELPTLQFPEQLNCATELLDRHVVEGRGARVCLLAESVRWTYADLQEKANRIANVLVREMGLVPGNRVLLRAVRSWLTPAHWLTRCWSAFAGTPPTAELAALIGALNAGQGINLYLRL